MLFSELFDTELEVEMRIIVADLLEKKAITSEIGEGKRIDELNDYIEKNLADLKMAIEALPTEQKSDWKKLNDIFIDTISKKYAMKNGNLKQGFRLVSKE